MHRQTITLVVIIFVLIVAGMIAFAYLRGSELQEAERDAAKRTDPSVIEDQYGYLESIEASHAFKSGTHTLSGELMLPSPCHVLSIDSQVAESYPEQVTIMFMVDEGEGEQCAQVLTPRPFSIKIDASERASFRASLMGRAIPLLLSRPSATSE